MAEPTPSPSATSAPALGSTADAAPYVSVSWVAVGAALATGVFLLMLLFFGYAGFKEKKPLLLPELLVFPVVAIVLSFAARKLIRNSEGTRTEILFGVDLVKSSWWISLVVGLGYFAYLVAIDYSVRRDAASETQKWVDRVLKDDRRELRVAFIRTREPGRRHALDPDDENQIAGQFGDEYVAFKQVDLVLLAKRNPGECKFNPVGVKDWLYQPGTIKCVFAGTVTCPEGTFPVELDVRGFEGGVKGETVGKQWAIVSSSASFIQDKVARTAYGWRIAELDRSAYEYGRAFIQQSAVSPGLRAFLYQQHVAPTQNSQLLTTAAAVSRMSFWNFDLGQAVTMTPDYPPYIRDQFIRFPGGGEPPSDKKDLFLRSWLDLGLLSPGARIRGNDKVDTRNILTFIDDAVEVRVPCEVPMPSTGLAARGRLVVRCSEPDVITELKRLRSEANPAQASIKPPADIGKRQFQWRVIRVESDLHEVKVQQPGPGGPGGQPGPPGG